MDAEPVVRSRLYPPSTSTAFAQLGLLKRDFFPHRVLVVPRTGPDGLKLADRCGLEPDLDELWQVLVYATDPAVDSIPRDLWFDRDLQWHQQHLGLPGLVASVTVLLRDDAMYTFAHQSDIVQRIGRRREHKTRVEKVFGGWDRLLLNAILATALEWGVKIVHTPTADLAIRHTDQARRVERELFDRVYDRHVPARVDATRAGDWWRIDTPSNLHRIVSGEPHIERLGGGRTVAICHDVEAGLGHLVEDPALAVHAGASWTTSVRRMLDIEGGRDVRATYNIVGTLFSEIGDEIRNEGHTLGFHSYDHRFRRRRDRVRSALWRASRGRIAPSDAVPARLQPARCRQLDGQVLGYRPARSILGPDTSPEVLVRNNFEWLANSARSFGTSEPRLERRLAKVPIATDDFALYRGRPYDEWHSRVLTAAANSPTFALSLHDCYAAYWLDRYPSFLDALLEGATVRTLDEIAAREVLCRAI